MPRSLWYIEWLFLLAPLVLVPLALECLGSSSPAGRRGRLVGGLAAAAAFGVPRGPLAGLLAGAWMLATLTIAVPGLRTVLRTRRPLVSPEIAIAAGRLSLPVGAGWLVLSRLGIEPLGFAEPIVLLTAVHFHYAAFLALVLVGLVARLTPDDRARRWLLTGTVAGTPLVAAGLTLSPWLELAGAATLAGSLWLHAVRTLALVVPRLSSPLARVLLVSSSLAVFPSMALAVLFACGRVGGEGGASMAALVTIHGPLNALGFAGGGLLGCWWEAVTSRRRSRNEP